MYLRRTPVALLPPAPPIVICVIAQRQLAANGPLPLPVSGGGHASANTFSPAIKQKKVTFRATFIIIEYCI